MDYNSLQIHSRKARAPIMKYTGLTLHQIQPDLKLAMKTAAKLKHMSVNGWAIAVLEQAVGIQRDPKTVKVTPAQLSKMADWIVLQWQEQWRMYYGQKPTMADRDSALVLARWGHPRGPDAVASMIQGAFNPPRYSPTLANIVGHLEF